LPGMPKVEESVDTSQHITATVVAR